MPSIKRYFRPLAGAALLLGTVGSTAHAAPPAEQKPSMIASFEGRSIQLADGWGDARACASDDGVTARCYRSEAEMEAAEGGWSPERTSATASACALPGVRLYRGTSMGGGVLQLTAQFTVIDLAPYGFDNDTSSYRIGVCSARFYDSNAGVTAYPGNTNAGASATSMLSGWDNRVSSVYIS